ncbi:unnamed protein product [Spirodela intermedia]|uniref:LysM domain-containing protein n=1 Tax=Spirodela intermedia TaxID=51605 RepID=A0A7I8J1J8_SPIIN|nr:unnamed protein product [Spirodela intermedia]CAA6663271.1 unnamed protein product [Spirodela intermedia]
MAARYVPLFFASFLLLVAGCAAEGPSYSCSSGEKVKCQALAGYVPENETTYEAIKDLFQVQSLFALYGANNLSTSTAPSTKVRGGNAVRVPFPCACYSGTWASDRQPIYKVKKGDGLYNIATTTYRNLVVYERIAAVNNVTDVNFILEGQELWIPLPCSCDAVGGLETVHLAHIVEPGSSVAAIAAQFGTTEKTLLELNNIADPKSLQANKVLDVPLRACNSSIRSDAVDGSLRVPNGRYALTAGNCIKCSCSSSSWQLACEIANLTARNTSACRAPACSATNSSGRTISLKLGEDAPSVCGSTRCHYAGYYNTSNILNITAVPVTNQSTCAPLSSAVDLRPLLASLYAALLLLATL